MHMTSFQLAAGSFWICRLLTKQLFIFINGWDLVYRPLISFSSMIPISTMISIPLIKLPTKLLSSPIKLWSNLRPILPSLFSISPKSTIRSLILLFKSSIFYHCYKLNLWRSPSINNLLLSSPRLSNSWESNYSINQPWTDYSGCLG